MATKRALAVVLMGLFSLMLISDIVRFQTPSGAGDAYNIGKIAGTIIVVALLCASIQWYRKLRRA